MRISKKLAAVAAAGAVTVAATGVAFAYFTSSGTGTGSATVAGANPTDVTVTGAAGPGLYPGGSVPVSFTATNNSATQSVAVGTIHLVSLTASGGCVTSAFHMADVASGQVLAGGATNTAVTAPGSLSMDNSASNQDNCKNATLSLVLSVIAP